MKTKQEIKEWLLENAMTDIGDIDLSDIDFGCRSIILCGIKAGNIDSNDQIAERKIKNNNQKAENIYNDNQEADGIHNYHQIAKIINNNSQQAQQITAKGQTILPRKITLKEIEKKLGYKIEVID